MGTPEEGWIFESAYENVNTSKWHALNITDMLIKQMSDPRTTDQPVSECLKHQWHGSRLFDLPKVKAKPKPVSSLGPDTETKSNLHATFGLEIPFQGVYFNCSGECCLSCIYPCGDCTPSPWGVFTLDQEAPCGRVPQTRAAVCVSIQFRIIMLFIVLDLSKTFLFTSCPSY